MVLVTVKMKKAAAEWAKIQAINDKLRVCLHEMRAKEAEEARIQQMEQALSNRQARKSIAAY